jgi:hypothetical protein
LGREKFFKNIREQIIKEFTLKDEYKKEIKWLLNKIAKENSVSIHVRRGDVLDLNNANVLGTDYYKKAISEIKKKIKNPKFYVFSDDIKWCKENFSNLNVEIEFMDKLPNKGYHTLEAMRNCKNNILANSALSWWAGYLNSNPKKIIVAPKNFTHFKDVEVEDNIIQKDWIVVN